MSSITEIEKLYNLQKSGAITEDEFNKMKESIINGKASSSDHVDNFAKNIESATKGLKENDWAMFLHLSQLLGFVILGLGFLAPVVIWLMKKDESELIDQHGRIVINWILSQLIYFAICFILIFVVIGGPLMVVLSILGIIYAIMGGIKAKDGQCWTYPGSFKFLK